MLIIINVSKPIFSKLLLILVRYIIALACTVVILKPNIEQLEILLFQLKITNIPVDIPHCDQLLLLFM